MLAVNKNNGTSISFSLSKKMSLGEDNSSHAPHYFELAYQTFIIYFFEY
jgi:hypothetical protein